MSRGAGRPPRKGLFQPGQSGYPRGRSKGAKNLQTCIREQLAAKVTVVERGVSRQVTKTQAIAMQLVNKAAAGDPKGLAAVVNLTREYDEALPDSRLDVLARAEDAAVIAGIIARIRGCGSPASDAPPPDNDGPEAADAALDDPFADQTGDA